LIVAARGESVWRRDPTDEFRARVPSYPSRPRKSTLRRESP